MNLDRFYGRLIRQSNGCLIWTGALTADGYGCVRVDGRAQYTHRVAYELNVGPIPDGHQIDHLCRRRACAEPTHLEAVTQRENVLRGEGPTAINARRTHCIRNHPLAGDNLQRTGAARRCRQCARDRRAAATRHDSLPTLKAA